MRRAGWLALGGFALTCRAWPAFSRGWMDHAAQPALLALHRWTGRIPFPLLEPLALIALGALLARPRWWRGALGLTMALYLALWFPARTLPVRRAAGEVSPARLIRLCDKLVDDLNAGSLDFPPVSTTLALTGEGVKAARWPEWMRLFRASGLFMPLTGEALLDPAQPEALAPFTARHELMHLSGVADEGEANIRAWQACAELGGFWADSARLWALRYAAGLVPEEDARRMAERMNDRVRACFTEAGGPLPAEGRDRDYRALVDWLAAER